VRALIITALIALVGTSHAASAQTTSWTSRARVSVNVGIQPSSITFTGTTTKPVYLETASINTTYGVPKGTLVDGGILFRLVGNLGVGVAVSTFAKQQDGQVSGSIPHPFFFNTPRSISGTAPGLQRSELVTHIQAAYVVSTKRIDVAVAGGPSFFNVSQDLVSDVTFTETYPYDTATFATAPTAKVTVNKVGFNAGVDVGVKLSRSLGVGGLVRFSRASVLFPLVGSASGVSSDAGGLQVGGGVRFYF
jgi:hypothetical protein